MLNISPIFNAMMRNKSSIILIVMQIALTLAIVSNAAFIIKERIDTMQRDSGLPETQLIGFDVYFYDDAVNIANQLLLDQQKLLEVPGVIEATPINQIPLSGSGDSWSFRNQLETDGAISSGAGVFIGNYNIADVFGHTIAQGRNFRPDEFVIRDNNGNVPKVTIITQALADELFPESNAVGKFIYSTDIPIQVIGIIDKMQGSWVHSSLVEKTALMPMINVKQFMRFIVRIEPKEVNQVIASVQELLLALENRRVVSPAETLIEKKERSYQSDKLMTNMLVVIITVLVFITALGIAGMTIFNVNRRQKQIGTRRALGASRMEIQRYFMTESALIAGLGIVIGVVLALVLNNYLMTYFSATSLSLNYIVTTIVGIVLVIEFAVFWPARKASMISPAIATRSV
ncbi:FtsX-like permease family protein [Thalassotalea sp. G2M2-11]|uniref:ABC transporter permease n=1 Tax=Thalassotalea sp. G2M2-11 TaxID=2787627 RepID=UPI0019D2057E|nr:FtsX-like permease family protein [Thalassotalea sp. G2M2-11]